MAPVAKSVDVSNGYGFLLSELQFHSLGSGNRCYEHVASACSLMVKCSGDNCLNAIRVPVIPHQKIAVNFAYGIW